MELQIIQNRENILPSGKRSVPEEMKIYDEQMKIVGEVLATSGVSIASGKLKLRIKLFDEQMIERFSHGKTKNIFDKK